MNNVVNKSETLEILLSTMNRNSLGFLDDMFRDDNYLNYNILIVNQTTNDRLLVSDYDNIRVINSFEKGLPQSRNLAIENASGDICLIADDDVTYKKDFDLNILNAFEKFDKADIITFQMVDDEGKLFKAYQDIEIHDKRSITKANSVVIAFRKESLIKNSVSFNTNFGLGTMFPTANEYVFLRNALKANLKLYYEPIIILSHPFFSSGKDLGNDKIVFARAALFYKYSGILSYFRLCKYLYLVYRKNVLALNELFPKFIIGTKGIKAYRKLVKLGLEKR